MSAVDITTHRVPVHANTQRLLRKAQRASEALREGLTPAQREELQILEDKVIFGAAYVLVNGDGTRRRIDPRAVAMHRLAPVPTGIFPPFCPPAPR